MKPENRPGDNFIQLRVNSYKAGQLLPENFEEAVKKAGLENTVKVNHRDGNRIFHPLLTTFSLTLASHVQVTTIPTSLFKPSVPIISPSMPSF